jgi:hypothetical protein
VRTITSQVGDKSCHCRSTKVLPNRSSWWCGAIYFVAIIRFFYWTKSLIPQTYIFFFNSDYTAGRIMTGHSAYQLAECREGLMEVEKKLVSAPRCIIKFTESRNYQLAFEISLSIAFLKTLYSRYQSRG